MKKCKFRWVVAVLITSIGWLPAAVAQDEEGSTDDAIADALDAPPPTAPAEQPQPAGETPATAEGQSAEAEDATPPDPNSKLYWSELRNIYTYQPRQFLKSGRFGVTVYGGLIPNNIFEQYFPVGLRLNYFILENIGVELAGSYAFKSQTKLQPLITESGGVAAQQVLIGDTQVSHTNFGVVWSPFYGKTSFYDNVLTYFDVFLFAGAGIVITETTPTFNAAPEKGVKPEGALGGGMAFFFGQNFALRGDFRQFVFPKVKSVGGVANPSEVSLGLSLFF